MSSADGMRRPRGRRPGGEDTRSEIVSSARTEFATHGYEGTTLRGIARAAGVDPRLVHHYFGGKDEVFAAAMEIPVRPAELIGQVIVGDPDGLGERLVRMFLSIWDAPEMRERIVALMASVLTSESAAAMIRQFLTQEIFGRVVESVGGPDRGLRAGLAASAIMGLLMARYIVRIEPLTSVDPEALVPLVAPTLQRYLTLGSG